MPRILSLETSTSVCSVALHQDNKLISLAEIHQDQAHASKLAVLINQVLENASCGSDSLNAVAVSAGPGSYTGLRIGTSTAKGLCFALDIPLIAVGTLELMARKVARSKVVSGCYCPMLDARRMEVYYGIFDENLKEISPVDTKVIDTHSFDDLLQDKKICFFGPGAAKCAEVIAHPNAVFIFDVQPSAVDLGDLAMRRFGQKQFEDLVTFEPHYLKEFLVKKSTKFEKVMNK